MKQTLLSLLIFASLHSCKEKEYKVVAEVWRNDSTAGFVSKDLYLPESYKAGIVYPYPGNELWSFKILSRELVNK